MASLIYFTGTFGTRLCNFSMVITVECLVTLISRYFSFLKRARDIAGSCSPGLGTESTLRVLSGEGKAGTACQGVGRGLGEPRGQNVGIKPLG